MLFFFYLGGLGTFFLSGEKMGEENWSQQLGFGEKYRLSAPYIYGWGKKLVRKLHYIFLLSGT